MDKFLTYLRAIATQPSTYKGAGVLIGVMTGVAIPDDTIQAIGFGIAGAIGLYDFLRNSAKAKPEGLAR